MLRLIKPEDFGATGWGTSDDTEAMQMALNSLRNGTGLCLKGVYRTTRPLHLPSIEPPLRGAMIFGRQSTAFPLFPSHEHHGRLRSPYLSSAIVVDHNGPAFLMSTATAARGIRIERLTMIGLSGETDAFVFQQSGKGYYWIRDFRFTDVAIRGFRNAFVVKGASQKDKAAVGNLQILGCNIQGNKNILVCENDRRINLLRFVGNDAGQNSNHCDDPRMVIAGRSIIIKDNFLEGQKKPLRVCDYSRTVQIIGNDFERIKGTCITVTTSQDVVVGPNFFTNCPDEPLVCLQGCKWGTVRQKRFSELMDCTEMELHP
jgi:hypothetical protein